jgi:hypothetical protein
MPLIELEQQALKLSIADQIHLIQVLVQRLTNLLLNPPPSQLTEPLPPQATVASAIATFRQTIAVEGLDINPDEIWGDVRDRTPISAVPKW